jgi:RNA polymerase sigma-70 factor (ECF subfamily)
VYIRVAMTPPALDDAVAAPPPRCPASRSIGRAHGRAAARPPAAATRSSWRWRWRARGDAAALAISSATTCATAGQPGPHAPRRGGDRRRRPAHPRPALVAEPGAARVVEYAGRGRLRGLVQVVATRLAVDHTRAKDRPGGGDELDDLVAIADDPELAFLKATYRAAWREAFTAAVGDLDARARNLLRLHHLGGATLEQLAAMYGVHRATAVRWLADARAGLLRGTRRRLTAALAVSPAELDSILALIGSRLEASVGRLLADDGDPG